MPSLPGHHESKHAEKPGFLAGPLARLLRHGSSLGGVRPKSLFRDDQGEYIAKFPSVRDPAAYSVPRLEAASLSLAVASGIDACRTRLVTAAGRDILLVHRFDILANRGRRHVLSLRALGAGFEGRVYGYLEAASLIRRTVSDVDRDLRRFYRQMVFNVAIGNTDDHEGNFSILYDGVSWSLSPAYDLLPDVGERVEHALDFATLPSAPDRRQAISLAPPFGLTADEATVVIDEVAGTIGDVWRDHCRMHGIEVDDSWFWAREIERRVRSLEHG